MEENLLKVSCYLMGLESSMCCQFSAMKCWILVSNSGLMTIYCNSDTTWSKKDCSWD